MAKGTTNAQGGGGDENAIMDVALGSDGKSLDFTAAGGQVSNVVIPSSAENWISITNLSDLEINKIKIGTKFLLYSMSREHLKISRVFAQCCRITASGNNITADFATTGYFYNSDSGEISPLSAIVIAGNTSASTGSIDLGYSFINSSHTNTSSLSFSSSLAPSPSITNMNISY